MVDLIVDRRPEGSSSELDQANDEASFRNQLNKGIPQGSQGSEPAVGSIFHAFINSSFQIWRGVPRDMVPVEVFSANQKAADGDDGPGDNPANPVLYRRGHRQNPDGPS